MTLKEHIVVIAKIGSRYKSIAILTPVGIHLTQ